MIGSVTAQDRRLFRKKRPAGPIKKIFTTMLQTRTNLRGKHVERKMGPRGSSTKEPSSPSTKSPVFPSTKSPTSPSTKSPSFPSTKSPSFPSTKSPSFPSTKSPSFPPPPSPSSFPTMAPVASSQSPTTLVVPTLPPVIPSCILEAHLGYPDWEDPDEADYYGYHSDYLTIYREGEDDYCDSSAYPEWCSYLNTVEGEESAYIANVDDYYYTEWAEEVDVLQEEIITIKNAGDTIHYVCVTHWFNKNDYYAEYKSWNDFTMAAKLIMKINGSEIEGEWSHPVDLDTPTHIDKNGKSSINPDYDGNFCITVTCTDLCDCNADDYTLYDDNYYWQNLD